ncbi:MAG: ABC transporter permease [Bdellovibrionales bacterium CG10_big_fil_rev_8_21_14_0_10_45_34]|nr:MAG: ABC transporter permease [Bdellovibrionales bacterium CG10_big_fil_rev_8_21_14_0_10_45_34]
MVYVSFRATLFHQTQGLRTIFSVISAQIYFTGFQALPIISVLALGSGAVVMAQSQSQASIFGASVVAPFLIAVVVREIGPLLVALIVIARSGTAVASELGNMKVNREIEALESMGIHPYSFIVFPRLVGGMISVICLAAYFCAVALMGGYLIVRLQTQVPLQYFLSQLVNAISMDDYIIFFLKNTFSGFIIFSVSCFQGLQLSGSAHEVPQVTTRAVVRSVVYVVSFNLIVTILFYLKTLLKFGVLR